MTEVFFSYSHKDEEFRGELAKHLSLLKRQGIITDWYDRDIDAGTEWADRIDTHLNTAQIILLLISPDFMASDYCYEIELRRAMERYESGEACVIPIIIRPVDWHTLPFSKLQVLPKDAKAVARWENRDEAFLCIAQGIRRVAEDITKSQMVCHEGNKLIVSSPLPSSFSYQHRYLEQKHNELERRYDILSEEIQFLQSSEAIEDLSPKQCFRLKKQIEELEEKRNLITQKIIELKSTKITFE